MNQPKTQQGKTMNLFLILMGMMVLAGAAHAQLTVEKKITVDKNVPDNGVLRTGFTWSGSGLSYVDSVSVSVNLSSPFTSNPIDLSDLSGSIRHGLTGEEGARTGTLFSAGSMNSMSQTFTQAASLDGNWLASNYWRLDLADGQGGGIAQLEDFTFSVTGTAANSGTLDVGAGGTIAAASAGTQEIGAAITSSGSGTNAVKLNAGAGKTLQASGGLSGSGELKKQGEGALKLNSSSAGFTGKLSVEAGEVEIGNASALGSGSLDVAGGARVRVNPGVSLSNAIAVASGQMQLAGGTNNTDVSTVSSVISGSGGIEKTGAGRMVLAGTNTFTGATTVSEGKLEVNGSIANSSTTVANGGTLGGSGTVGALEIASGGTLAVGNSPGQLNAGNTVWAEGASLAWEVVSSVGNEDINENFLTGKGSNWDFLNVTGTLNITATSGNKFIIDVISLLNNNTNGAAAGFDLNTSYTFGIATASGGIQIGGVGIAGYANASAFDAALAGLFDINTGSFANNPGSDGLWSISTAAGTGTERTLLLSYAGTPGGGFGGGGGGGVAIPEPSSAALTLIGLGVLALRRRCRR